MKIRVKYFLFFFIFPVTLFAEEAYETMEDITVSATRIDSSLYDVPAAIGYVDQTDISSGKQMLGLDESLVRIPGMFMQNRNNFAQSLKISIRGFGARANFGTRGIKLYQDGIPLTTVAGQGGIEDVDLNSINRIEVMRGPASSLYGSSSGGVIHFYTGDQDIVEPYVEANYSKGEYATNIANIKTGGQLNKLDYFLNLSHLDSQGYRSHNRTRNSKFNSKFKYNIDESSEFTTVLTLYDAPQADDPGGINFASMNSDRRQARPQNITQNSGEDIDQQKLGFVYKKEIGQNQQLELRNYYVRRDFQGLLPITGSGFVEFERFQFGGGAQYSIESNLFGFGNRTIIGLEVDTQEDDRQRYNNNAGAQGAMTVNQLEQGDSVGIYLRNETALAEKWDLSLGLRYDNVSLELEDFFLSDGNNSSELNFEELSPMAGLLWKAHPSAHIYANISSVFETPTFTELANVPAGGGFTNVTAQKALNFELGIKGAVSPRFNYDFAVFHIDVDDEIINVQTIGSTGVFNNADTTREGIEASVSLIPYTGVNMLMSYTYNDFTFDNFPVSVCTTCAGNELPGLPEHNFYAELAYTHASGFFSSIDFQFVSTMFTDNANTGSNRPYGVSNLRAGYVMELGDVEFTPYAGINNLFDEEYVGNVRINAFGGRYYEPAPEFNAYAGLNVRYLY
jgi:iron complex outermembrane recepter protein